ncbi:PREDICTED: uncharacterized protein LOC109581616 [Amphimedon queenslandica]|uniref:Uncharacterized protein n=1 Tax=Amphimedon queenslandica TaxID=400682 RepID=A0A1X7V0E3_AMPQE|nr:PREDICTED: uncharacterized protein LOC109581616 [Amphimedon queenslandica]|eukprot:XP_019851439.1 PREDICTED: uncharacterized protein LOC109581616 [Amphimedon queenslandica]
MGAVKSLLRLTGSKEATTAARQSRKWTRPEPVVPPSSSVSPDSSNEQVLKNLKSVYVDSTTTHQKIDNPYKPSMAQSRATTSDGERTDSTNKGLLSVNEIIAVLEAHRTKSKTIEELSQETGVNSQHLTALVQNFGNLYIKGDPEEIKKLNRPNLEFHPLHK